MYVERSFVFEELSSGWAVGDPGRLFAGLHFGEVAPATALGEEVPADLDRERLAVDPHAHLCFWLAGHDSVPEALEEPLCLALASDRVEGSLLGPAARPGVMEVQTCRLDQQSRADDREQDPRELDLIH